MENPSSKSHVSAVVNTRVSTDEVMKVAKLSRLALSESDVAKVQKKFSDILGFFEVLDSCSTEGVEPLYHASEKMILREDQAASPLTTEELLQNAPEEISGCFHLPRVVASGE